MRSRTVGYTVAIQDSSDEDGSPESLVGPFADGASELQSDSENFFTDVASDVEGGVDFLPNLCADRARMLADRAETLRGEDEFLKELLDCSVPASSEKQKKYKYGGCRIHPSCSLQPHLAMGGKKPGALKLRCSKWFKFHAEPKDRCWFSCQYPRGLLHMLPPHLKECYSTLDMALSRGAEK